MLGHNIIQHLECDVFSGLINLKCVILKENKLQYLHPDTFVGLPKLEEAYYLTSLVYKYKLTVNSSVHIL